MSDTYSLICKDCEKRIWIGQKTSCGFIYSDHRDLKRLSNFLFTHSGSDHSLLFLRDEEIDVIYQDFEEHGAENDHP